MAAEHAASVAPVEPWRAGAAPAKPEPPKGEAPLPQCAVGVRFEWRTGALAGQEDEVTEVIAQGWTSKRHGNYMHSVWHPDFIRPAPPSGEPTLGERTDYQLFVAAREADGTQDGVRRALYDLGRSDGASGALDEVRREVERYIGEQPKAYLLRCLDRLQGRL